MRCIILSLSKPFIQRKVRLEKIDEYLEEGSCRALLVPAPNRFDRCLEPMLVLVERERISDPDDLPLMLLDLGKIHKRLPKRDEVEYVALFDPIAMRDLLVEYVPIIVRPRILDGRRTWSLNVAFTQFRIDDSLYLQLGSFLGYDLTKLDIDTEIKLKRMGMRFEWHLEHLEKEYERMVRAEALVGLGSSHFFSGLNEVFNYFINTSSESSTMIVEFFTSYLAKHSIERFRYLWIPNPSRKSMALFKEVVKGLMHTIRRIVFVVPNILFKDYANYLVDSTYVAQWIHASRSLGIEAYVVPLRFIELVRNARRGLVQHFVEYVMRLAASDRSPRDAEGSPRLTIFEKLECDDECTSG